VNGSEDGADAEGVVTIPRHFNSRPVSFSALPFRSPHGVRVADLRLSGVAACFFLTVLPLSVGCWRLLEFVGSCCFRMRIIECFCGL